MEFSKEFLSNTIFRDQPLVFDPKMGELIDGTWQKTGVTYLENGDIHVEVYAPNVGTVKAVINKKDYPFEKRSNGMFILHLNYDSYLNGPLTVDLFFDGLWLLYPTLPIYWSASSCHNYIEFPGEAQSFAMLKDVPHGAVTKQTYYSKALGNFERCLVYTPPGYMKGTEDYPVLYLQHGFGENETVWDSTGRICNIMDNLIAEGKCVPFIVVMNNNMLRYPGNEGGMADHAFERMLLEDCIPFIEENYRAKTDKWNRAICGLSMGSYLTNDIALFHPELFGYMGALTGCMHHHSAMGTYTRPYHEVMKEGKLVKENFRIFYQSATPEEDHLDYCLIDKQICEKCGVSEMPGYRFIVHPKGTQRWSSWRTGLRDFAKLLFRDASVYENRVEIDKLL